MSQIFSYLTPPMLLEASQASRKWRAGVLDNGLWKRKFNTEGWMLDAEEIQRFEKSCNGGSSANAFAASSRTEQGKQKGPMRDFRRRLGSKNRGRQSPSTPSQNTTQAQSPLRFQSPATPQAHNVSEQDSNLDHEMPDVESASPALNGQDGDLPSESRRVRDFLRARDAQVESSLDEEVLPDSQIPTIPSSKESLMWGNPGSARLNYHHIFKQKRKLENNWDTGRYKSFQLPHRNHPEDAHTECVYTIQYSGKYLVSGSRDRTLRIWNLDTQRLVREPLQGHTGSVLCLQFDDHEQEDLIVSGSSDESVILWRFSTGKMIKRLSNAHKESVLNLKFDKRFLVTCSKDKTIKIWNRHELKMGDRDYPIKGVTGGGQCPAYIIDIDNMSTALREPYLFPEKPMILEAYTHLMTLDLHGAAVNAIQIYKDELVSASGDRNIRVWNIHTGESSTKMETHTKGIACVQYDGMRIVSGSSDRTIRIWDPVSKTEVARLDGHNNLVRTIQAAFADYPGGRRYLEAEALEVERKFREASMAGLIDPESGRKQRGTPGSRKPKDFKSVGAKIPPSGGGGRWGRIVSGSYDETIIIWKKTPEDEWVIGHRLRQEEALRAAGPPLIPRSDPQAQAQHTQATLNLANQIVNNQPDQAPPPPAQAQSQQPTQQSSQVDVQNDATLSPPVLPPPPPPPISDGQLDQPNPTLYQQMLAQAAQRQQGPSQPSRSSQQQLAGPVIHLQNPPPGSAQAAPHVRPRPLRPVVAGHPNQAPPVGQPNARVFKLQFDARRIICCSQDPKIVGWDFANGDEQIMECSRFFAPPQ